MKKVIAYIYKGEKFYIGECLGIDVITQGRTIDETLKSLKDAVALYFRDEKGIFLSEAKNTSLLCQNTMNSIKEH